MGRTTRRISSCSASRAESARGRAIGGPAARRAIIRQRVNLPFTIHITACALHHEATVPSTSEREASARRAADGTMSLSSRRAREALPPVNVLSSVCEKGCSHRDR